MKNMMKEYLGEAYSKDHLKNFCRYWMKGREMRPKWENYTDKNIFYKDCDEWRRKNDLDCIYFGGDLRADTLMSAWTPIQWVANCLNREYGMKFIKEQKGDPNHYLRLLAEDRDAYLPPKHELVQLLDRFLELAEERCNYILLPHRDMNTARYNCVVNGKKVGIFDEVPAMLYHVFDKEWFGKYFEMPDEMNNALPLDVVTWIKRERLEVGFTDGVIDQAHVIPLIKNQPAGEPKWLSKEEEIKEALGYMIYLLESRKKAMEKG